MDFGQKLPADMKFSGAVIWERSRIRVGRFSQSIDRWDVLFVLLLETALSENAQFPKNLNPI